MFVRALNAGALAALLVAGPALAQLRSDDVPRERTVSLAKAVREEADGARYRLGPVRLFPRISLSNAGYNNNVLGGSDTQEAVGDWTATVAAGLGYLVPFGSFVFVRGEAVPEYTWFKDLSERRAFGGTVSASVIALPNAFQLDVGGEYSRSTIFYSAEAVRPVLEERRNGHALLDVPLTSRLAVFGSAKTEETLYPEALDLSFQVNDRRETVFAAGLSYQVFQGLRFAGSFEKTQARFDNQPTLRDNDGTAYLGSFFYDRPRFFVNLVAGYRKYEPHGSTFEPYGGSTGGLYLSYFITRRLEIQLSGRRGISNSLGSSAYFVETIGGAALDYAVGRKLKLGAFAEAGTNRYPLPVASGSVKRKDDVTRYGGTLGFELSRLMTLQGRVTRDQLRSNVPGVDRSVTYFNMGLAITATPKSGKN